MINGNSKENEREEDYEPRYFQEHGQQGLLEKEVYHEIRFGKFFLTES